MRRNEIWARMGPKNEEIGFIGQSLRKQMIKEHDFIAIGGGSGGGRGGAARDLGRGG